MSEPISEREVMEMEAANWVARRMGDEAFDGDGFEAWTRADPRRRPLFDAMWGRIMGPEFDGALQSISRRQQQARQAIMAGLACVVALFGAYNALPSLEMMLAEEQLYAAGGEASRVVRLADGTQLTLAPEARVAVRYTRSGRRVELEQGTIFASVARDPSRPFRVEAGEGEVTVLGTRFEVSKKAQSVHVAVEHGHVRFGMTGWFDTPIDLIEDQTASLSDKGVMRGTATPHDRIGLWRKEWQEYDGVPLRQVVADLESLSPLPIAIAEDRLGDRLVSGRIRLTAPRRQIENLALIHHFNLREDDGKLVISETH